MPTTIKLLICYYIAINIVLFVLMAVDKVKARRNEWRIKEATLFICALLGGGIGGFLGMKLFHHKTKKWYFHVIYAIGIVIHLVLIWCVYTKI